MASLFLTVTWMSGHAAGIWLITMRIFQGVGAAMLMANSAAILTDVFPDNQRGMALGVNQAAAFSGTFIGLVLGGLLAPINWRLIFLVSVPIGLFATVFGYYALRETSEPRPARIDWPGNVTFAVGLILVMVGITYGIEPYGHHTMGWTSPTVIGALVVGAGSPRRLLRDRDQGRRADVPAAALPIRAFTSGVLASFLAALSRGGLMFMLIIWLQGIWLPLHGYAFSVTPLWAGHRHAAPHPRVPRRRPGVGHPLRPLRGPPLRHRGDDRHRRLLPAPGAAARRLPLLALRRAPLPDRAAPWPRSDRPTGPA